MQAPTYGEVQLVNGIHTPLPSPLDHIHELSCQISTNSKTLHRFYL